MVETIRADLFGDRVYVFTPKGDLLNLPVGSTPIDFAYYVHSEIGHRCRGALVNGKMVRLDYQLKSRDRVEIITAKRGGPSRDWLNKHLGYVRTSRARTKIAQWFRKQDRELNINAGRQTLERLLKQFGMRDTSHEDVAKAMAYDSLEDFLAAVGYGGISNDRLVGVLLTLKRQGEADEAVETLPSLPEPSPVSPSGLTVRGVEGLMTKLAHCCEPLPGEPIIGFVTRGSGVTIHRVDCPNVLNRNEPERLIQVSWGSDEQTYPVPILVKAWDRSALLRDITSVVAAEGINISASSTQTNKSSHFASIYLILNVKDAQQLARVMTRVERVQNVVSVERSYLKASSGVA